jgi:DNA-directed RNA polymerase subunit RPC12/RpoP
MRRRKEMHIYEYKCNKCGKEYLLKTPYLYNGETVKCPNCESEDFKITDYHPTETDSSCGEYQPPVRFG